MNNNSSFPRYRGKMEYFCLGCSATYDIKELYYTCPQCGGVFLLRDTHFQELKKQSGAQWRDIFDSRMQSKKTALRGIFRFYELMAPVLEEEDILYLGEGQTPVIEASGALSALLGGQRLAYKNDGQNPSASFKDRGMACAFSFLRSLLRQGELTQVLAICASTGDTSAAAALYAAYVGEGITSAVLLPAGKVTSQQLAQPLGSGATVLEIPGVFDDCMKVVEYLADNYDVALLNSKNAWRILGQQSYAFEVAQWYDWDMAGKCIFVPIGNAGNITAVMSGFLKLYALDIINALPRIFGVQSHHADPVYQYYSKPEGKREYKPVEVAPSVAQAAMIGNPVSFPRVEYFVEQFIKRAGEDVFHVVQVTEQEIIESMLLANSHGHIACTQGGESLAGLVKAQNRGLIQPEETAILDSTAHMLKFIEFQEKYFHNTFPVEYEITPDLSLANAPYMILSQEAKQQYSQEEYIRQAAKGVAARLGLKEDIA